MALTQTQAATLKAAILAETAPSFVEARTRGDDGFLAAFFNAPASPTLLAWRTAATARDLDEGADYSAFDSVQAGKRDAWALFLMYGPRDLTRQKARKVITDVWGNATAGSVAEAILQAGSRAATRGEKALGGNSPATTGTVTALRLTFEGSITSQDIVQAKSA